MLQLQTMHVLRSSLQFWFIRPSSTGHVLNTSGCAYSQLQLKQYTFNLGLFSQAEREGKEKGGWGGGGGQGTYENEREGWKIDK